MLLKNNANVIAIEQSINELKFIKVAHKTLQNIKIIESNFGNEGMPKHQRDTVAASIGELGPVDFRS